MNVGDKVEMISNLSKELKLMPKPRLGTVIAINGAYVLVRPDGKEYEVDFLSNEVKLKK